MSKKHIPLIIGNWKQNPSTIGEAQKLFVAIRKKLLRKKLSVRVVVAAPAPFISSLVHLVPSKRIDLCAQDVSFYEKGTHTGEISVKMLKSVGASSVIIGHSERRAAGESDDVVQQKLTTALTGGLTGILCVGEQKRDTHGHYFTVVEKQLRVALKEIPKTKLAQLVVAYEPVWAISKGDGKGKTATPEDAHEMKLFIQKIIADMFGRNAVQKVRILYGGSINAKNAEEFLVHGELDGYLVGGASLRAADFGSIIATANTYAKA